MSGSLPPELDAFVKQAIANGEYTTEEDVLVAAVRALRALSQLHGALRADIQQAIDDVDAGRGRPWNSDAMIKKFNDELDASQSAA